MPRKLPPNVERFRDRHGKIRFYYRVGKGPRTALPMDVTGPEFIAAWQACLCGEHPEKAPKQIERVIPGSIAALIISYKKSASYLGLRASSKIGYARRLEALRIAHGHRSVAGMTRGAIIQKIMQPYAGKPGAGIDALKKLRILIRHAIDLEWLNHDPSLGIRRPKLKEIRSWSDDEVAQFERFWPIGSKQRTAFALHLYTGQRVSDVHRMTWADTCGGHIRILQQKTGAKLTIAVHSELRAALAKAARSHVAILTTEYGKPFSSKGYGQWLRDAITKAGLPLDCQPHGLRKAAGRRLAEAGCSTREIMAILGHKSVTEAERYTRDADQARLATAAITRLEDRRRTAIPKPADPSLGKASKS